MRWAATEESPRLPRYRYEIASRMVNVTYMPLRSSRRADPRYSGLELSITLPGSNVSARPNQPYRLRISSVAVRPTRSSWPGNILSHQCRHVTALMNDPDTNGLFDSRQAASGTISDLMRAATDPRGSTYRPSPASPTDSGQPASAWFQALAYSGAPTESRDRPGR